MIKKIKELWNNRKWTINLYYNGIKIKKLKVYRNELEDLKNKKYEIKIYFIKQLFKSNIVQIIVSPAVLLYTDEAHKKISVGVIIEQGIRL